MCEAPAEMPERQLRELGHRHPPPGMTLREQLEIRKQQWEAFNRWEEEQPQVEREPGKILADLGAIWSWLPREVREHDPDPEKIGIQKMQSSASAALSRVHDPA